MHPIHLSISLAGKRIVYSNGLTASFDDAEALVANYEEGNEYYRTDLTFDEMSQTFYTDNDFMHSLAPHL